MTIASPPPSPRVALIGAGRVGTAVAVLLQRSGCPVTGIWSRSAASIERARALLDAPVLDLSEDIDAQLVLIGAADPAIAPVAESIAPLLQPGTVVAHFSGSLGPSELASAAATGALPAALHPVQACPDVDSAIERLPGSAWGITVPHAIREWADELIRAPLRGTPVHVREEDRPLWHAACVSTSNGIAALMAMGEKLLSEIGMRDPETILAPLAAGTVGNARAGGGGGATLTGPVVRGEQATVQRHLDAIAERAPHLLDDYRAIVQLILAAARAHGRVDDSAASDIEGLLS